MLPSTRLTADFGVSSVERSGSGASKSRCNHEMESLKYPLPEPVEGGSLIRIPSVRQECSLRLLRAQGAVLQTTQSVRKGIRKKKTFKKENPSAHPLPEPVEGSPHHFLSKTFLLQKLSGLLYLFYD